MQRLPALLLHIVGIARDEVAVAKTIAKFVVQRHIRPILTLSYFFSTRTVKAGELFCMLASPVAVPSTSTVFASATAALAAALTSSSSMFWPMAIAPFTAVTLAGRFRSSTAIGPL